MALSLLRLFRLLMRCDRGEGGGEEGALLFLMQLGWGAEDRVGSSLGDTSRLSSLLLLRSGWVGAACVVDTFGVVWLTGLVGSGVPLSFILFRL